MRLRKRQRLESTDYRKVSELVHDRRAERDQNPEILRENSESAEAAVRTYSPEQRLRTVDRETQQLVEDSRDIPRTWDPDGPPKGSWLLEWGYLFVFGGGVIANVLITIALANIPPGTAEDGVVFGCFAVLWMTVLAITSIAYFRQLGAMAWLGLTVCVAELLAFLLFVSR
jgi:hypothetical protein